MIPDKNDSELPFHREPIVTAEMDDLSYDHSVEPDTDYWDGDDWMELMYGPPD